MCVERFMWMIRLLYQRDHCFKIWRFWKVKSYFYFSLIKVLSLQRAKVFHLVFFLFNYDDTRYYRKKLKYCHLSLKKLNNLPKKKITMRKAIILFRFEFLANWQFKTSCFHSYNESWFTTQSFHSFV